jgi:hypothetical protein
MPTKDQALQFMVMVNAGLPASHAIMYFLPEDTERGEVAQVLAKWMRSKAVQDAQVALQGKSWQEMTLDERIHRAVDNHYSQLAYLLFSTNYVEVGATDKSKLDTARQALEAKLAGVAGKTDALSQFFNDINTGKIKLARPTPVAVN